MGTKELKLPADLVAKLDDRVAKGEAQNAVEVVRHALAALEAADDTKKLDAVRAKISRSLSDPRPSIPAGVVFDRLDQLLDSLKQQ